MTEKQANHALKVLEKTRGLGKEGLKGFEWPDYKNENERIEKNNAQYKGMSLNDAMFKHFRVKPKHKHDDMEYKEIKVGDNIPLKILSINKRNTVFDNSVYKDDISCNVNLFSYKNLVNHIPAEPIMCRVISKDGSNVVVDPFVGMFEEWLGTKLINTRNGKRPALEQYSLEEDHSITVKNLHLLKGGYVGSVVIPTISEFVGQDVCIDAFIPGSQIVLNIENDFSRWEGQSVRAFVYNYIKKPGTANDMSLVCSAKEVLKLQGQQNMIKLFGDYTEDNKAWHAAQKKKLKATVTGIIKSSKKSGVFVEIQGQNITGMIDMPVEDLVNYKPGMELKVCWSHFDEPMFYNRESGQFQHQHPYIVEDGILKEFNIKPIFKLA